MPTEFLRAAERYRLTNDVDRWVVHTTLGDESFLDFVVECLDRGDVLHSMGCTFALDDFGSGLDSFANLENVGLDYLKLNGSLIQDLQNNSVNQAMVAAMIKPALQNDVQGRIQVGQWLLREIPRAP